MYLFNRITVKPQLPKRINKLSTVANNLWWSWNTEFLRLFQRIDMDLWEQSNKNPVKFLKHVSQERLEEAAKDVTFLKEYDKDLSEEKKQQLILIKNYKKGLNRFRIVLNKSFRSNKFNENRSFIIRIILGLA